MEIKKLTKNEFALIKAFQRQDLIEKCHNCFEIFNVLAFLVFIEDLRWPHVEALRRSYRVWRSPDYTPEKYQDSLKIRQSSKKN